MAYATRTYLCLAARGVADHQSVMLPRNGASALRSSCAAACRADQDPAKPLHLRATDLRPLRIQFVGLRSASLPLLLVALLCSYRVTLACPTASSPPRRIVTAIALTRPRRSPRSLSKTPLAQAPSPCRSTRSRASRRKRRRPACPCPSSRIFIKLSTSALSSTRSSADVSLLTSRSVAAWSASIRAALDLTRQPELHHLGRPRLVPARVAAHLCVLAMSAADLGREGALVARQGFVPLALPKLSGAVIYIASRVCIVFANGASSPSALR